jgi:hypothetical protein
MSALELVVPEALPADGFSAAVLAGLALPNLDRIGARAQASAVAALPVNPLLTPWQAWLLRHQPEPNLARYWAHALDVGPAAAAHSLWLAEPVRLEVGLDQVSLVDPAELGLTEAHAVALAEAARPVLEAAGWQLSAASPGRWLLEAPSAVPLAGAAVDCAIGANIVPFLPGGASTAELQWRRVHNEIQMTWFDHPVNRQREAAGLAAVNGLWLSGTGATTLVPLPYAHISSDLEWLSSAPCTAGSARILETFTGLIGPARRADWFAWRTALAALDTKLGVHLVALKRGEIDTVELVFTGEHELRIFKLSRRHLASFWRRGTAARLWEPVP